MEKINHHLCIILDKSGSMDSLRTTALQHVNEQIQTAKGKSKDFDIKVTFITFNYDIDILKSNEPVDQIHEIPLTDYRPNGGTALNDAVAVAIDEVMCNVSLGDTDVLFAIVSDGQENHSVKFPGVGNKDLAEKVQTMQEKYSWTFTYMGTDDFDLTKAASAMNIPLSNVHSFERSLAGMEKATHLYSCQLDNYYGNRVETVKRSDDGKFRTKCASNLNFFDSEASTTADETPSEES